MGFCFGSGNRTLIETTQGSKEVQKIVLGDEIISGSFNLGNKPEFFWRPAIVQFSAGTNEGYQSVAVSIIYGDYSEIIVTPDNVFMLSSGKRFLV